MARTGMTNTDLSEMCFKITVTQRYMASKHDITKHKKKKKYKSELVSRQNCFLYNSNFRSAYKTVVRVAQILVFCTIW